MANEKNKSIFDNINEGFFKVLANGSNKDSYEMIVAIDDYFGSGKFDVDKDELSLFLSIYIARRSEDTKTSFDDEDKTSSTSSYGDRASAFLRRLVNTGWLDKDSGADFKERLSRSDAFMKIVPVLREIAKEDESTNEYYGLSQEIYRNLTDFDYSAPTASFEQLHNKSIALTRYLLSVNSQMKRFIKKALEENKDERVIVDTLLNVFQKHPSLIALNNLQGRYNPEIHHRDIILAIERLRDQSIRGELVHDYLETKRLDATEENISRADEFIDSVLNEIEVQFNTISDFIKGISSRNASYVLASKNMLEFRLNNFRDIQSNINECLKLLRRVPDDFEMDSPFDICSIATLDDSSLYKPRLLEIKAPESIDFIDPLEDPESIRRAQEMLRGELTYSKVSMNDYVRGEVGRKRNIKASDLSPVSEDIYIKALLIPAYHPNGFVVGEPNGNKFTSGDYIIDDYEITKEGE